MATFPYDPAKSVLSRFERSPFEEGGLPGFDTPQPDAVDPTMQAVNEALARVSSGGSAAAQAAAFEPEQPSFLSRAWDTVSYPLKVVGGAGGAVGGSIAGALLPEAAKAAEAENFGGADPSTLPLAERLRLAPGLGDVLAQTVPESVRESSFGTAVGPVARVIGNIAGDPTSYSPRLLARLATLGRVSSVPRALERAAEVGELGAAARAGGAALRAGDVGGTLAAGGRALAATPFSPIVGAAYLPELAEGVIEGGREAISQAGQGNFGQAAAQGVNAILQAGLANLVRKGLMSEVRARQVAQRAAADEAPSVAPEEAGAAPAEGGVADTAPEAPAEAPPVAQAAPPEAPQPPAPTEAVAAPPVPPQAVEEAPAAPPTREEVAAAFGEGAVRPDPDTALADVEAAARIVLAGDHAPGSPEYEAFTAAGGRAMDAGIPEQDLQALFARLEDEAAAPKVEAPPAPTQDAGAPPAPAAAPKAELPPPTHPAYEAAVKALEQLKAEGKAPTKATLQALVPGISKSKKGGKDKATGASWGLLARELVERGVLERAGSSEFSSLRFPQAEEAIRVSPDLEIADERLIDALRLHVLDLVERLPKVAGTPEADVLAKRITKYTDMLATMSKGLSDPGLRTDFAAPALRAFQEDITNPPAKPERADTSTGRLSGEAEFRRRVAEGEEPEGFLAGQTQRPLKEEPPLTMQERVPRVDAGSRPSPALYGSRGRPSSEAKKQEVAEIKGGVLRKFFERKVGGEKLPIRELHPVETARIGKAIGGAGFSFEGMAKKELREGPARAGISREKWLANWMRKELEGDADAVAAFNARVKEASKSPGGLALYDELEAKFLKDRPGQLVNEFARSSRSARVVQQTYEAGTPGGDATRSLKVRESTKRLGNSPEDAIQESVRNLIVRYAEGDPAVVKAINENKSGELTALLRTASKRGTRKGESIVMAPTEGPTGETATVRKQGLENWERAEREDTDTPLDISREWGTKYWDNKVLKELQDHELPRGVRKRVAEWHRANDGFDKKANGNLSDTGKSQLVATMNRLAEQVEHAEQQGLEDLRNALLARLSNYVSTYHGEFVGMNQKPWSKIVAGLRLSFGIDQRSGLVAEDVARHAAGLTPNEFRNLRARVHVADTLVKEGKTPQEAWEIIRKRIADAGGEPKEVVAEESLRVGKGKGPSAPPFAKGTTPSKPSWLLGPEQKRARAAQFAEAEATRATPIEGTKVDVVDYDGSGIAPDEMSFLQAYGKAASDALTKLHARVSGILGAQYSFKGYTASPAREGVFFKDGVRQNPLFHLSDALEDARRVGGEDDPELIAAFAAERAAAVADHEGLHALLPHGDAKAEKAFEDALSSLRKVTTSDKAYRDVMAELRKAVSPDVVEQARKAMGTFRAKVQEAHRAVERGEGSQRQQDVLDRARPTGDQGGRRPGGDSRGAAVGDEGGVRARRLVLGSPRSADGARAGDGTGAGGRRAEGRDAEGAAADRTAVRRADEGFRDFPQEAKRLGVGQALSKAVGAALGLPAKVERPEDVKKVEMVLGNGPLGSGDPVVKKLHEQIILEARKAPSATDAVEAHSRPAHGKEKLQPGELDIAVNLPKLVGAGSDHTKAAVARALKAVDPSHKNQHIRAKHVDSVVLRMLNAKDVHEAVIEMQKRGVKDLYDLSLLRRYFSDQLREFDDHRAAWLSSVTKGDQVSAKKAEQAMNLSALRMAISGEASSKGSTGAARMLALLRMEKQLSEPLNAQDSFAGQFQGALRRYGVTADSAREVTDALFDAVKTGDSRRFNSLFNAAFAPTDFKGWTRRVLTYWKSGMMGPPTQVANLAGNASFKLLLRDAEHVVAAGLERVFKGQKRERFLSEVKVSWMARRKAAAEAFRNLREDMADIVSLRTPDLKDLTERTSSLDPVDVRALEDTTRGKAHQFFMQPLKVMSAVDRFFQTLNRAEYIHREAYREARKAGLTGTAAYKRMEANVAEMERALYDPFGVDSIENRKLHEKWKDALEHAGNESSRDVFQGSYKRDVFGIAGDALDRWSAQMPLLDLLFPFKKTPINVAKEGWRRTPFGFYSVWRDLQRGDLKPQHAFDEIAKPALGTVILGMATMAALEGELLTGQGPTDPFQQQTLKASGWQPYSFKIGNKYVPYNRFEPLATILGIGADIADGIRRGETSNVKELIERGIGSLQQNLTNKTFLQGAEAFFSFWSDPFRAGQQWIKQLAMSAVPNTVGLIPFGTAARAIDPTFRQTNILTAPLSKIPFYSQTLPQQYGTLGEVRQREGNALSRLLLPIQVTEGKNTPAAQVAKEIDRIGMNIQRPRTYVRGKGGRYDYSPEDQALLAGAQANAIEAIAKLIDSEGYRNLPDNEDDPRAALGVTTKEDRIRDLLMQYRRPVLSAVNTRAAQALAQQALSTFRSER